jgi:hypothetical protein
MAKGTASNPIVIKVGEGQSAAEAFKEVLDKAQGKVKEIEITSATIKKQLLSYAYEIKTGVNKGDTIPTRNGSKIVHQDLTHAFEKLHVHLAFIDRAFKTRDMTAVDIDDLHEDEITDDFYVVGFDITDPGEDMKVVLRGKKVVDYGTMGCVTPSIHLSGEYPYSDELKVAILDCVREVELYMGGKAAPTLVQAEIPGLEGENDIEE